ncbi:MULTISPECIES: peptidoglycan-associated lipoprotein Pal [Acidithiobacillus]|jgi:peptidoglycan-associated lipoprotein|uniref:Peptidoglycan-associated lipoprotein n=3 Tax=Acidithiobacillus caldus TaxID=33059 RepID=F9ZTW8_ACICS|nr:MULTISPECIES: peptidoglycan-associated lipoprotein Pal [Acidithiobacillus]AEK59452.1 peptidoglycan-associated outer membrane lipoprotein [Acidithiobacillus caldus SM-1]AIA56495.1 Outer membrane protein (OmpA/MotB precursor) [Acidithiobacillus caldus ATCC 51756]AUW33817.1 peptidoglycan-associated lipoprotein Pal [Acidithiobacillus caldus]MBU2730606.1 peptidoglycan-associated lipoprotein Pal [Acidithiobacillus caldus]MBU2735547.1 peptidoglycan-associated lipoprotein Pal [Acidithiobacillus cal
MDRKYMLVALTAAGILALAGCASNVGSGAPKAAGPVAPAESANTAAYNGAGIGSQQLDANGPIGGANSGLTAAELAALPQHLRVHFGFNSDSLDARAQEIASQNAQFMMNHAHVKVRLEGNTDDRGTQEYNLALGERRAEAVKRYLEAQGVSAARISTVSFGKDNPLCNQNDESCWAKNRRVDFVYSGGYNGG